MNGTWDGDLGKRCTKWGRDKSKRYGDIIMRWEVIELDQALNRQALVAIPIQSDAPYESYMFTRSFI